MAVRLVVAVTDGDWFDHLRVKPELAELNFWSPSATNFRALEPGELFLFKLHAPRNFVVGGGVFAYANSLPCSLAWEAFGESNGANSLIEMRARIAKYRRAAPNDRTDFAIGCRILTQPFFLPEQRWIPMPDSWSSNIVSFKGYSTDDADGLMLWNAVQNGLEDAPSLGFAEEPGTIWRTYARSTASRTRCVPHTCYGQLSTALRSFRREDASSIGRRAYSSVLRRRCSRGVKRHSPSPRHPQSVRRGLCDDLARHEIRSQSTDSRRV